MTSSASRRPEPSSRPGKPPFTPSSRKTSTIARERSRTDLKTGPGQRSTTITPNKAVGTTSTGPTPGPHLVRPPSKSTLRPPSSVETQTCRELMISAESSVKTALGSTRRMSVSGMTSRRTVSIKSPANLGQTSATWAQMPRSPGPQRGPTTSAGTPSRNPTLNKPPGDVDGSASKVVGERRSMIQLGPSKRRSSLRGQARESTAPARAVDSDTLRSTSGSSSIVPAHWDNMATNAVAVAPLKKALRPIRKSLRLQARPLIPQPSSIPTSCVRPAGSRSSLTAAAPVASAPATPATKIPRISKSRPLLSPPTPFPSSSSSHQATASRTSPDMGHPTPVLPRLWTDDADTSMDMIQDTSMSFIQGQEEGLWDTPIVKKHGLKRSIGNATSSLAKQEPSRPLVLEDHATLEEFEARREEEKQKVIAAERGWKHAEEQRLQDVQSLQEEKKALSLALLAMQAERNTAQAAAEAGKRERQRRKWEDVVRAGREAVEEEKALLLMIAHLRTMFGISNSAPACT